MYAVGALQDSYWGFCVLVDAEEMQQTVLRGHLGRFGRQGYVLDAVLVPLQASCGVLLPTTTAVLKG